MHYKKIEFQVDFCISDWLLQEPVLSTQDLPTMLKYMSNPSLGLSVLDKVCTICPML